MSSTVLHLHPRIIHNVALENMRNAALDITIFDWPMQDKSAAGLCVK